MKFNEIIKEINKMVKSRSERDSFYYYMTKARKLGIHEDYAEHVYENIKRGNDINFSIELAAEDLDL